MNPQEAVILQQLINGLSLGMMYALLALGFTRFIELGPGTALSGFMKRIDRSAQMLNVADAASLEATVKALS